MSTTGCDKLLFVLFDKLHESCFILNYVLYILHLSRVYVMTGEWFVFTAVHRLCCVQCTCSCYVKCCVFFLFNRKPVYKHYKTMKRIQHIARDSWIIIVVRIYAISYVLIFLRNYKCVSSISRRLLQRKRLFIEKYLFRVIYYIFIIYV